MDMRNLRVFVLILSFIGLVSCGGVDTDSSGVTTGGSTPGGTSGGSTGGSDVTAPGSGNGATAGTSVPNPPSSSPSKASAALIAKIFESEQTGQVAALVRASSGSVRAMYMEMIIVNACYFLYGSFDNSESIGVETSYLGGAGSFGASSDQVSLLETDYCYTSDGLINTSMAADGSFPYISFQLNEDVSGSCTISDATESPVLKASSYGVARIELDSEYFTDGFSIFGHFIYEVDDSTVEIDCTLEVSESLDLVSAVCTDSAGAAVELDESAECSVL